MPSTSVEAPTALQVSERGLTLDLRTTALPAGRPGTLEFVVRDAHGDPVTRLQPCLGAYGHLVAPRSGDPAHLHVHPHDAAGGDATSGPAVSFAATTPSTGTCRLFLDFKVAGEVRTAAFTVTAGAGRTAPPAGHSENEARTGSPDRAASALRPRLRGGGRPLRRCRGPTEIPARSVLRARSRARWRGAARDRAGRIGGGAGIAVPGPLGRDRRGPVVGHGRRGRRHRGSGGRGRREGRDGRTRGVVRREPERKEHREPRDHAGRGGPGGRAQPPSTGGAAADLLVPAGRRGEPAGGRGPQDDGERVVGVEVRAVGEVVSRCDQGFSSGGRGAVRGPRADPP